MIETEITIDRDLITITAKTAEFLLDKNPDSLSLYVFYLKNAKIQKTNQIWSTDTFGMKGLKWGVKRYSEAKQVLLDSGLLTFIQERGETGRLQKTFIKLNYIHRSIQKPQAVTTASGQQQTNALSNKREMLEVIKENAYDKSKDLPPDTIDNSKQVSNLPDYLGKTTLTRVLKLYNLLWFDKYGNYPTAIPFGKSGALLKPIIGAYSEYQIACLLKIHFSWHGVTGSDEFVYKQMSNRGFSLTDFRKNVDLYIAYLTNSIKIEYNVEESVRQFAFKSLGTIIKKFKKDNGIE